MTEATRATITAGSLPLMVSWRDAANVRVMDQHVVGAGMSIRAFPDLIGAVVSGVDRYIVAVLPMDDNGYRWQKLYEIDTRNRTLEMDWPQ